MTLRLTLLVPAVLAVALFTGCGGGPIACTEIAAASGITVTVPRPVARAVDTVDVEVCQDDECRRESARVTTGQHGPAVASVPFGGPSEFASAFDAGPAQVTTMLRQDDVLVATSESTVELSFSYPNGRECDGDAFLHGAVRLEV